MPKISATIITLNEEKNIGRCIKSLRGFADEIIVLDSFSTDNTQKICEKLGVRFLQKKFEGYGKQKQKCVSLAKNDFIISLDADECLSPDLLKILQKEKKNLGVLYDGFIVNRRNNYCGQWIKYCGWYPDKKCRIFNRNKLKWESTSPHEKIALKKNARVKKIKAEILHYTFVSYRQHKQTMSKYAKIYAQAKYDQKKDCFTAWLKSMMAPFLFVKLYFIKRGFLDGRAGFLICYQESLYKFRKYWTLQKLYLKNDK